MHKGTSYYSSCNICCYDVTNSFEFCLDEKMMEMPIALWFHFVLGRKHPVV
jgi:hypothetical protein